MSILIKGMEMPKSCYDCSFAVEVYDGSGVYACVVTDKCVCRGAGRHDDCPLVSVPPHGRLIDADAAAKQGWTISRTYSASLNEMVYEVKSMTDEVLPTIIEAEEGE